jgi:hypothetical protein
MSPMGLCAFRLACWWPVLPSTTPGFRGPASTAHHWKVAPLWSAMLPRTITLRAYVHLAHQPAHSPTQKRAGFEPAYAIFRIHRGLGVGRTIFSPRAASVLAPRFVRETAGQCPHLGDSILDAPQLFTCAASSSAGRSNPSVDFVKFVSTNAMCFRAIYCPKH